MAIHVRPTAPLAPRVLLPGDPGRALSLAQALLHAPAMFNHNRGLWGYTGAARADEQPLTIQSTGMGGPSAAIVISELIDLGASSLLRVGTCGAIAPGPRLGDLLAVGRALAADGTSRALGAGESATPSPPLLGALLAAGATETVAATTDLFYDPRADVEAAWVAAGASVVEMEAATLFTLGAARDVATGALLAVTDLLRPERERIDDDGLRDAEQRLGDLAVRALADGRG